MVIATKGFFYIKYSRKFFNISTPPTREKLRKQGSAAVHPLRELGSGSVLKCFFRDMV